MSHFQQLLTDYTAIRQASSNLFSGWQPSAVKPVQVQRQKQQVNARDLHTALSQLGVVQGWLLITEQCLTLNNQPIPTLQSRILSAEFSHGNSSFRVRELGADRWLLLTTTITETDAAQATHLMTRLSHLATETSLGKLHYQQLWCRNSQGRLHIEDAVFIGFQGA